MTKNNQKYPKIFIILYILNNLLSIIGAQLLKCPQNKISFEKFVGIQPKYQQKSVLLVRSINDSAITFDCLNKCASDYRCSSFLLDYTTFECFKFENVTLNTQNYDYDSKSDTNVVWFRKSCLIVPNQCQNKRWSVEIVSGATLIGYDTKKIRDRVTRQRCIQLCLEEETFQCKSAKFSLISRYQDLTAADPLGFCVLSETDRHLTPNVYRVSRFEDEYIENQCVNTSYSSDYCAYEEYDNTILQHIDVELSMLSQKQCEQLCDASIDFNCRGYSTIPAKNICLLHSEDSKLIGPKQLTTEEGATYFERARCLNVTVTCASNLMWIVYRPEQPFFGRIYTSGHSETPPCFSNGHNNKIDVQLKIPLVGGECGVNEAQTAEPWNRTLKSVLLIIQYSPQIQTQADRLIKIGCIYGNTDGNTEISLGTSVNFTNSFPNHGSTVVNTSTVFPVVSIRIVDANTKEPIRDTEIGQELQMIIEISPGNGPYDIRASNLIATSGNNTLQLLDNDGCPTSLDIFPPFTKIQTNTSRLLVATFQAFKFPSSSVIRFNVMVHFCTVTCPPMHCSTNDNENRVKRETNTSSDRQFLHPTINATINKINKKQLNETDEIEQQMPLNIELTVRGVNILPDQLVYSENNRILIAGYDAITNEVCLDYNLFVGLLVIWVLLQVIIVVCCYLLIRKYKKYFHIAYTRHLDDMHQNFGFGSRDLGRRVHWADQ